jgi:hypothetical protein
MPIVGASDIATGASAAAPVQAPVAASNVATGASAAAPVQAPVAASNVTAGSSATGASAAGASAAAPVQAHVHAPFAWDAYEDPYELVPYVTPENPYDTSIVDDPEVTLCSLVLIPFQCFCVRSSIIRVCLFLVQSFCVRSCIIRVRLFLVQSFCVRSCLIRVRLYLVFNPFVLDLALLGFVCS